MNGKRIEQALSEQDLELLSQYLDGELAPSLSRALEARLHREPALQSGLLGMQELNQRLRDAVKEKSQVPAAIRDLLQVQESLASQSGDPDSVGSTNILSFPRPSQTPAKPAQTAWVYAAAASVVAAVALTLVTNLQPAPQNQLPGNDARVTAALDSVPSGDGWVALDDGREIQPVLSFPHEDGRWCREYLLRGGEADWRAVACRNDGNWVTQAAGLEAYLDAADAYRPAGAGDSAPVASFISQHAGDIALGRQAESALIARKWAP